MSAKRTGKKASKKTKTGFGVVPLLPHHSTTVIAYEPSHEFPWTYSELNGSNDGPFYRTAEEAHKGAMDDYFGFDVINKTVYLLCVVDAINLKKDD